MSPEETAARARVIEVARGWMGTPFHDVAGKKGVGVDCAHLIARVYEEAGMIPLQDIETYSPQFMLHRDDPLFEQYIAKHGHPVEAPQMADIVLYKIGRSYSHGGIVVNWPGAIIHAFKNFGFVAETDADESSLRGKPRKFYSLW